MRQLLTENSPLDAEQLELEDPIADSPLLRTIQPHKQALNQGEIVELIKHDQLDICENKGENPFSQLCYR